MNGEINAFEAVDATRASVAICNAKGLHARASAKFVKLAERFDAIVSVRREASVVGGTSIMGLMMLAAGRGATIEIAATGDDAEDAVAALSALVADGFGENGDG